jgi:hypothetical protein
MEKNLILGLDISTSTVGISLFEDRGTYGKLIFLKHVSPKVKPKCLDKMEELFKKANIFTEEFLDKYIDAGIKEVIIEEPLLMSQNVNTVISLIRFNAIISKMVFDKLGIIPKYISSYDARKYSFEELMAKRQYKKNGESLTENEIKKNKPVLFGDYHFDVDKKMVIWEKVSELEPAITWTFDKKNKLEKQSFDCSDAYVVVRGYMKKEGLWKK